MRHGNRPSDWRRWKLGRFEAAIAWLLVAAIGLDAYLHFRPGPVVPEPGRPFAQELQKALQRPEQVGDATVAELIEALKRDEKKSNAVFPTALIRQHSYCFGFQIAAHAAANARLLDKTETERLKRLAAGAMQALYNARDSNVLPREELGAEIKRGADEGFRWLAARDREPLATTLDRCIAVETAMTTQ